MKLIRSASSSDEEDQEFERKVRKRLTKRINDIPHNGQEIVNHLRELKRNADSTDNESITSIDTKAHRLKLDHSRTEELYNFMHIFEGHIYMLQENLKHFSSKGYNRESLIKDQFGVSSQTMIRCQ